MWGAEREIQPYRPTTPPVYTAMVARAASPTP